jgi:hypothetical protein
LQGFFGRPLENLPRLVRVEVLAGAVMLLDHGNRRADIVGDFFKAVSGCNALGNESMAG